MPQRNRRNGGSARSSKVTGGASNNASRRSVTRLLVTPAAAFSAIQWRAETGGVSVTPAPRMPFGGTPKRIRKARLPGSMFRCRPQDHPVSRWPRRASLRISALSCGQLHIAGLKAKRYVAKGGCSAPRRQTLLEGFAAFGCRRRGVGCGGRVFLELAFHLFFLFALLFQFLLPLLEPEIGFCQVVFSSFGWIARMQLNTRGTRARRPLPGPAWPVVNNTPSAALPTTRMSFGCRLLLVVLVAILGGCSTAGKKEPPPAAKPAPGAKYYKDDGPGDGAPADVDALPDAVPRVEPLHRFANRPYTVFGREYVPATSLRPYKERGVASWYGRKFHGEKTSSGETYDMYAMTAAHPTLPLPSYARVTNVATGKSVVVRVNDRGPFLHDRVIDLSYAAASKLGIAQKGSGEVEVEAVIPAEMAALAAAAPLPTVASAPVAASPAGTPPTEPAAAMPVAGADGGFVVQLGAFASNANAENFVSHLTSRIASVGVEPKVRQVSGLYRVFVGPYPSRDDARRVADRLRDALGLPSTIVAH